MSKYRKALITQSNYIPWKGYFDNIAQCDVFVVYDDMQYTKRDWRNRNKIKTENGLKWVSIPVEVKGKYFQKINETIISESNWNKNHLLQLKHAYSKSNSFKEVFPWVEELYLNCNFTSLTEINLYFIKAINNYLGIKTKILDSREFTLVEGKTEKLVSICKELQANEYFTGPAAKNYMDESLFLKEGIEVKYFDYSGYKEYSQPYPPFEHGVTILDLIFSEAFNSKNYLKNIE